MPEPHDELDSWLNVQVKPLLPPPGTFERVSGQARRRRTRRAVFSAAGALAVAAVVAVVIPEVAVPAHETGRPASASRVSPAPSASPRHPTPETSGPAAIPTPTGRPTPAVSQVPAVSSAVPPPLSVTFVGTSTGWVMGQALPAGQCNLAAAPNCVVLQRTDTAETGTASWRAVGAPPAHGPSGPSGVSQVRFLNLSEGWAFGPDLWATHDGGQSWTQIDTGGLRVTALEARGDRVFAVWAHCTGKGPAFASHCTHFSVYSSSAGTDAWVRMPFTSSRLSLPHVDGAASLVLTGTSVYLLLPGGHLLVSPLTGASPPPLAPLSPMATPCEPGPAQASGQPSGALLAADGSDLALVCTGPPAGDSQRKTVYVSRNRQDWHPMGTAPSPGTATSLAESPSGTLVLATSLGIDVSADGGATWTAARGARPAGGFAYVGMTTASQGVAVPADPSRRAVWFTHDGGSTWTASRVGT